MDYTKGARANEFRHPEPVEGWGCTQFSTSTRGPTARSSFDKLRMAGYVWLGMAGCVVVNV